MSNVSVVALYASDVEDKKHTYSSTDKVERSGYVPNDKKIDTFISSGLMLMDFHANNSEYDLPESESEYESDSKEYLEELTSDAEKFDSPPLAQFVDKISANEILDDGEKLLKESEKVASSKKLARKKKTESEEIIDAIKDGFKSVGAKAEIPK